MHYFPQHWQRWQLNNTDFSRFTRHVFKRFFKTEFKYLIIKYTSNMKAANEITGQKGINEITKL